MKKLCKQVLVSTISHQGVLGIVSEIGGFRLTSQRNSDSPKVLNKVDNGSSSGLFSVYLQAINLYFS